MRPDSGPSASRSAPTFDARDPNFSTVLPARFHCISITPFSFFRLDLQNIIAQIFARDARPRSAVSSLFRSPPPIRLFALPTPWPRVGSGSGGINLWTTDRPADELFALPTSWASWIIITYGKRVARNQRGTPCLADRYETQFHLNSKTAPCPLDRGKVARTYKSRFNWGHSRYIHANRSDIDGRLSIE